MNEILLQRMRTNNDDGRVFPQNRAIHVFALTLLALSSFQSCARKAMDEDSIATYARAKERYVTGDYGKAIEIVKEGGFGYGSGHQALLLQAKCEFLGGKPDRAEAIFRKLLRANPRYAEAGIWLARSKLAQGRLDDAETEAERAMEWDPEDPRLLSLMGSIQEAKKEYQKAFEYYARSTGFAEETGKDEINLAELYWRFGQADKALERVRLARALISPESALHKPLESLEERMNKETPR